MQEALSRQLDEALDIREKQRLCRENGSGRAIEGILGRVREELGIVEEVWREYMGEDEVIREGRAG